LNLTIAVTGELLEFRGQYMY